MKILALSREGKFTLRQGLAFSKEEEKVEVKAKQRWQNGCKSI